MKIPKKYIIPIGSAVVHYKPNGLDKFRLGKVVDILFDSEDKKREPRYKVCLDEYKVYEHDIMYTYPSKNIYANKKDLAVFLF